MKYPKKSITFIITSSLTLPLLAGDLDPPSAPGDSASAMYPLQAICDRLDTGATGSKSTEIKTTAAPAPTGCTLNEVMNKAPAKDNTNGVEPNNVAAGKKYWGLTDSNWGLQTGTGAIVPPTPVPVAKTGQTQCYNASGSSIACVNTGQDGEHQKGATATGDRFTDNSDGTVTDNLTKLIWLKNANCTETLAGIDPTTSSNKLTWANAFTWIAALEHDKCGLSDNSSAGDWRLPKVEELRSLIDFSKFRPALSSGHPFSGVGSSVYYWSSTSGASVTNGAWYVNLGNGSVYVAFKTNTNYVWPVRAGQ